MCAPCSVQHRVHLIAHYAAIVSHGDLENLAERLADVLAWIVQHTTARRRGANKHGYTVYIKDLWKHMFYSGYVFNVNGVDRGLQ